MGNVYCSSQFLPNIYKRKSKFDSDTEIKDNYLLYSENVFKFIYISFA